MDNMIDIFQELELLDRQYSRLLFDAAPISRLGPPATEEQIAALETRYRLTLPADYANFLRLHNGWSDYSGCGTFLATNERDTPWVTSELGIRRMLFDENQVAYPMDEGAMPVVLGTGRRNLVVYNPATGQDAIVEYKFAEVERRHASFMDYLRWLRDMMVQNIKIEMEGR